MGNFIGDFVKGSDLRAYPESMALGIKLHREIDRYTDTHEVVHQSKSLLREKYRHYAPVIVDIFYDHFLAASWSTRHALPLRDFTQQFYRLAERYLDQIPKTASRVLHYMKADNWLYHYRSIEGIDRALVGMSRRTTFQSKMDEAVHDLEQHYDHFKDHFESFFPDLTHFSRSFIEKHQNSPI